MTSSKERREIDVRFCERTCRCDTFSFVRWTFQCLLVVETKSPCPIHRSSSKLMINETLNSNPGVKTISFVIARLGRLCYLKGDEGIKTPPLNVSYFPFISLTFPFFSVFFPRTSTYFLHIRCECWIQETKYYSRYKNTKSWKKKVQEQKLNATK